MGSSTSRNSLGHTPVDTVRDSTSVRCLTFQTGLGSALATCGHQIIAVESMGWPLAVVVLLEKREDNLIFFCILCQFFVCFCFYERKRSPIRSMFTKNTRMEINLFFLYFVRRFFRECKVGWISSPFIIRQYRAASGEFQRFVA